MLHGVVSESAMMDWLLYFEAIKDSYIDTRLGPCRAIAPKIVQYSQDYPDVDFYKVDVDQVTTVASELGVRAMPTFYLFKGGEKVGEVVGANPPALKVCLYLLVYARR